MKQIIFIFLMLFCGSVVVFGQQNQCSDISDCNAKLGQSAQVINKLLDVQKAQQDAVAALQAETASRERKSAIDGGIIAAQDKLIALYEKRKGTTISFLFGLIKIRKN